MNSGGYSKEDVSIGANFLHGITTRWLTNFNQTYFHSSVLFRIFAHYF